MLLMPMPFYGGFAPLRPKWRVIFVLVLNDAPELQDVEHPCDIINNIQVGKYL